MVEYLEAYVPDAKDRLKVEGYDRHYLSTPKGQLITNIMARRVYLDSVRTSGGANGKKGVNLISILARYDLAKILLGSIVTFIESSSGHDSESIAESLPRIIAEIDSLIQQFAEEWNALASIR
jgi:hypothetical protein